MVNEIDSMLISSWDGDSQAVNETAMKHVHHELSQSLIDIKNNIVECIRDLENTTHLKPSLVDIMKDSIKDIERAKNAIGIMRCHSF